MGKYTDTLDDARVENGKLYKGDTLLLSIGDEFKDSINTHRRYKCNFIDLHFVRFEKIAVGEFEKSELGKTQEFQTVHFMESELNFTKLK